MPRFVFRAVFLAFASAMALPASADGVVLKWKLSKGDGFTFAIACHFGSTMEVDGVAKENSADVAVEGRIEVISAEETEAKGKITFTKLSRTSTVGGTKTDRARTPKELEGKSVDVTLYPSGAISLDHAQFDEVAGDVDAADSLQSCFIALPEGELTVGEETGISGRNSFEAAKLASATDKEAVIEGGVDAKRGGEESFSTRKGSFKLVFNRAAGVLVSMTESAETVTKAGKSMKTTLLEKRSITLERK